MTGTAAPVTTVITGGVDTHADMHVAAAVNQVGGVLGTASFPTTPAGYRQLLAWLRSHGDLGPVGVEGTGSYGAALARHLTEQGVSVLEVSRPNRQVRRRHGKTDVVDAIAAARAVLSGEATATPKSHDGPVEALRLLKTLQRSGNKARTQALNQLHAVVLTAPTELRERLRDLKTRELLATCAAFRVRTDDDSLAGTTRLVLRELAQRIALLDAQLADTTKRLRRITSAIAPDLIAKHGIGPDTASTLLVVAGRGRGQAVRRVAARRGCEAGRERGPGGSGPQPPLRSPSGPPHANRQPAALREVLRRAARLSTPDPAGPFVLALVGGAFADRFREEVGQGVAVGPTAGGQALEQRQRLGGGKCGRSLHPQVANVAAGELLQEFGKHSAVLELGQSDGCFAGRVLLGVLEEPVQCTSDIGGVDPGQADPEGGPVSEARVLVVEAAQ